MRSKFVIVGGFLIALGGLAWGCAQQRSAGPQIVKIAVTDAGFQPAEINVHGGEPVTLLVTRTTDATCAKEIVIADAGIRQELPLNREVRISFTPANPGAIRYSCAMDMVAGTLRVE